MGGYTFNPRSYKRSDVIQLHLKHVNFTLSIHAPTRGATWIAKAEFWLGMLSIHAPTRGATWWHYFNTKVYKTFNPRSYKRSDAFEFWVRAFYETFNPRSYKRSDTNPIFQANFDIAFNPRSYKRSDNHTRLYRFPSSYFQSTLLQEERQQKCTIFLMHLCNNYCIVSI